MWRAVRIIFWAHFRILRNRLPRTSFGSVLGFLLAVVWFGIFGALAFAVGRFLSAASLPFLHHWLSRGLLLMFLVWQAVPLLTMTGGWSLEGKKLQIYPVSTEALFAIEVLLRITTGFEMLLVLAGAVIGLLRNPHVPLLTPLWLALFVPFNLFCALAIRELITHTFRNRGFREIFSIVVISLSTLPSFFLHTRFSRQVKSGAGALADFRGTPWNAAASLVYGRDAMISALVLAFWTLAILVLARWQFAGSLGEETSMRAGISITGPRPRRAQFLAGILQVPNRLFADPLAALVDKEIRALVRMPRFRVVFGMACFFSIIVFVPLAFESTGTRFMKDNFLLVVNLYGLLLLSDTLLWNIFGMDRTAAQLYFIAPVELRTVFRAKNMTAVLLIAAQNIVILAVAFLLRFPVTPVSIATSLTGSVVVGLFLLSAGNLSSVTIPRPIDPTQTLKRQAGGKVQMWLAGCALGAFGLVGFAFLARWGLHREWALFAVFTIEFAIGLIVFHISEETAVERALRDREQILDTLSRSLS